MSNKFSFTSSLPLPSSSLTIPRLGFGVYRSPTDVAENSCAVALKAGYRHIDSAQFYQNEQQVGDAVKKSGIPRSEIFLTTKILSAGGSVEKSYEKCIASVKAMDSSEDGYVDLFLIHTPNGGAQARKEMWLALERLKKEGKAKAIGVSNFGIGHIEQLKEYATTWPPSANQIELHPWCQQEDTVNYCRQNGIVVEAYSPLVRNYKANDPVLVDVAKKYNKSTQQILVRYALQKTWVPLPKSDTPERIISNADVFDFEISGDDMDTLNDLNQEAGGSIVQVADNS